MHPADSAASTIRFAACGKIIAKRFFTDYVQTRVKCLERHGFMLDHLIQQLFLA